MRDAPRRCSCCYPVTATVAFAAPGAPFSFDPGGTVPAVQNGANGSFSANAYFDPTAVNTYSANSTLTITGALSQR